MVLDEAAADATDATASRSIPPRTDHSFASASLAVHLRRGLVGFVAVALAWFSWPRIGVVALAPAAIGVVALRGCPTCWTIGLVQTVARGRLERRCNGSGCSLVDVRAQRSTGIGTVRR